MADAESEPRSEEETASEDSEASNSGLLLLEYDSSSFEEENTGDRSRDRFIGLEPSVSSTSDEESHFDTDSLEESDNEERLQGLHW